MPLSDKELAHIERKAREFLDAVLATKWTKPSQLDDLDVLEAGGKVGLDAILVSEFLVRWVNTGDLDKYFLQVAEKVRARIPLHAADPSAVISETSVANNADSVDRKTPSIIRILFLAANPLDTTPLRLGEEVRTIDERLRAAQFRERFELLQHHAMRITDLSEFLLRHQPHVVHFSGHGSSTGQIVLEDVAGKASYASPASIARLFQILKDNVRCVVLNACYSVSQAKEIANHIECVVGTSRAIGDEAAIRFAGGFYRALGYGRDLQTAFDLGCNEIGLVSLGSEETTPQLLIRTDVNPKNIRLLENTT